MARAWAGGSGAAADHGDLAQDMRRWGAGEDEIDARLEAEDDDGAPEILPANAEAVRAFLAADTQWRLSPSGAPVGLDYQGVLAAMAMLGIPPSQDLHERVRVMEIEARSILADRVADEQQRAARRSAGKRPPARPRRR